MAQNGKTNAFVPVVCADKNVILCHLIIIVILVGKAHLGVVFGREYKLRMIPFAVVVGRQHQSE